MSGDKRSRESDHHSSKRHQVQRAESAHHEHGAPVAVQEKPQAPNYSQSLIGDPRLRGRGNAPVQIALMQSMQQAHGNRAVQRFMQKRSAVTAGEKPLQSIPGVGPTAELTGSMGAQAESHSTPVQRCGPTPCNCPSEKKAAVQETLEAVQMTPASPTVSRKPVEAVQRCPACGGMKEEVTPTPVQTMSATLAPVPSVEPATPEAAAAAPDQTPSSETARSARGIFSLPVLAAPSAQRAAPVLPYNKALQHSAPTRAPPAHRNNVQRNKARKASRTVQRRNSRAAVSARPGRGASSRARVSRSLRNVSRAVSRLATSSRGNIPSVLTRIDRMVSPALGIAPSRTFSKVGRLAARLQRFVATANLVKAATRSGKRTAVQRVSLSDLNPIEAAKKLAAKAMGVISSLGSSALSMAQDLGSSAWNSVKGAGSSAWEAIKGTGTSIWNTVKSAGTNAFNTAKSLGSSALNFVTGLGSKVWNQAKALGTKAWDTAKNMGGKAWDFAKKMGSKAWDGATKMGAKLWDKAKSTGSSIWNNVKGKASSAWGKIKGVGSSAFDKVKSVAGKAYNGAKEWGGKALDAAKNVAGKMTTENLCKAVGWLTEKAYDLVAPVVKKAWNTAKEWGGKAWDAAKEWGGKAWNTAKEWGGKVKDFAKGAVDKAYSAIKNGASKAWNFAKDLGGKVINGAKNAASKAWNFAKDMGSKAWNGAKNAATQLYGKAKDLGTKAWDKAKDLGGKVWDKAKDLGSKIADTAKNAGSKLLGIADKLTGGAASKVAGMAQKILGKAAGLLSWVMSKAQDLASKAVNKAKEWASKALNAAKEAATKAFNTAKEWASKAVNAAKEWGQKAISTAKDWASKAFNKAKEWGQKAVNTAKDWASKAWNKAKDLGAKALSTAKDWASKAWNKAKEWGGKAWDKMKEWGGKAWDFTKKWAGKAWDFAKDVGGKLKKVAKDLGLDKAWAKAKELGAAAWAKVKEGAAALQKRFGPVIEMAKKAGEIGAKIAFLASPAGLPMASTWLACKTLGCALPRLMKKGSKTTQTVADVTTDLVPVVSTVKDGCACLTGENPVIGEKMGGVEQGISCASAAIDIASYIAAIPTGGGSVAAGIAAKQGVKAGLKATIKSLLKKGGKELAEKGAKELAEKGAKELAEKTAKELAEKGAKELAEKAAKEAAEKAAKEAGEKAIKEAAEKVAKETAEKEAKELAEKAAREAAEKTEKAAKEAAEKAAKEAAEKEAAEKAAKEAGKLPEGVRAGSKQADEIVEAAGKSGKLEGNAVRHQTEVVNAAGEVHEMKRLANGRIIRCSNQCMDQVLNIQERSEVIREAAKNASKGGKVEKASKMADEVTDAAKALEKESKDLADWAVKRQKEIDAIPTTGKREISQKAFEKELAKKEAALTRRAGSLEKKMSEVEKQAGLTKGAATAEELAQLGPQIDQAEKLKGGAGIGPGGGCTATVEGGVKTVSGWDPAPGFQQATEAVLKKADEIGYKPRGGGAYDKVQDPVTKQYVTREGIYYASHAEKQMSVVAPGKPIGVSLPMCIDCKDYFSALAKHTGQPQVVADPDMVRIFFPDGRVLTPPKPGTP
jgi:phage-related protein